VARAEALLEVGRPRQALAELARLGPDTAEDARAFRLRVEALIALDAWAAAARTARQGLALHSTDAELMGQLGLALHALGDYPGAERALLDALAIDPFDAVRRCRYALLCMSVGQLRKATRLVLAAAQTAPESAIVYVARVQLEFARGRDRAAERIAAEFVGRYPSMPVALALYGRSAALRGRTVAAYQSFARAVAEDPADEERARVAETLRIRAHPLLRPLRPLERVGPVGAWLATVVAFVVLRAFGPDTAGGAGRLRLVRIQRVLVGGAVPGTARDRAGAGRYRSSTGDGAAGHPLVPGAAVDGRHRGRDGRAVLRRLCGSRHRAGRACGNGQGHAGHDRAHHEGLLQWQVRLVWGLHQ